jgi:hypothetical protein
MDSEILPQSYGQPSITKYECWSLIFSKKMAAKWQVNQWKSKVSRGV